MNCARCWHPDHPGRVCGVDVTAQVEDLLRTWRGGTLPMDALNRVLVASASPLAVTCACGED